jgi:hypothetical protein
MKAFGKCAGILGLAVTCVGGAIAAEINFTFGVSFSTGPLAGQVAHGMFSVDRNDCPGLTCTGAFTPNNPAATLTSLQVDVGGFHFTAFDDAAFPLFPLVTFGADHLVSSIDYIGIVGSGALARELDLFSGFAAFFPVANPGSISEGSIVGIQQVPEPQAVWLVALALAGIAMTRRPHRLSSGHQ